MWDAVSKPLVVEEATFPHEPPSFGGARFRVHKGF
jgi:hypothetical protein